MKEYRIPCSLKQRKGKIDYHGSVRIDGEVKGDIVINATGNVTIGKDVEGASITCGGSLYIKGDLRHNKGAIFTVKENFHANSICGIHLSCNGDIDVNQRIENSKIRCLGRLNAREAIIHNSFVCALRGVLVNTIESGGNRFSVIKAGINFRSIEERTKTEKQLVRRQSEQQGLLNRLGPILQRALSDNDYARRMGQDIDMEMSRVRAFEKEIGQMDEKLEHLQNNNGKDGIACISVARSLQSGTEVNIGNSFRKIMENLSGPFSLIPDEHGIRPIVQPGLLLEQIS